MTAQFPKQSVFLTSYMRPELTKRSIAAISSWSGLKRLVVIIDGVRANAKEDEIYWRKKTISVVESFSYIPNLELWVYPDNVGITEHQIRLQEKSLLLEESPILLEEDIDLNLSSFSKLLSNHNRDCKEAVLRSGFSHSNHDHSVKVDFKGNLFLPLWGLNYNAAFVELVKKSWHDRVFNDRIVKQSISRVFPSKTLSQRAYKKSVEDFWVEYMSWAFTNRNRWDALANYSLWTQNLYSYSSLNRLAYDVSYMDSRGMNQRVEPNPTPLHDFNCVIVDGTIFCKACEVLGSRILSNPFKRFTNAFNYRVTKYRKRSGKM